MVGSPATFRLSLTVTGRPKSDADRSFDESSSRRAGRSHLISGREPRRKPSGRAICAVLLLLPAIGLTACVLAPIGWAMLRRRGRAQLSDEILINAIIERQSPGGRQHPSRRGPDARLSAAGRQQFSVLEGHLRNAILDASARERLGQSGPSCHRFVPRFNPGCWNGAASQFMVKRNTSSPSCFVCSMFIMSCRLRTSSMPQRPSRIMRSSVSRSCRVRGSFNAGGLISFLGFMATDYLATGVQPGILMVRLRDHADDPDTQKKARLSGSDRRRQ